MKEFVVQDGRKFRRLPNDVYIPVNRNVFGKFFVWYKCRCGRLVCNAGFAQYQHSKKCEGSPNEKRR